MGTFPIPAAIQKFFQQDFMTENIKQLDYPMEWAILDFFPTRDYPSNVLKSNIDVDTRKISTNGFRPQGGQSHTLTYNEKAARQIDLIPFILSNNFKELDILTQADPNNKSTQDTIQRLIVDYQQMQGKTINNTIAYACWMILTNDGVFEISNNDVSYEADYGIAAWQKTAANTLTSNDKWSEYTQADSKPFEDLETWRLKGLTNGGGRFSEILMNSVTFETFINHPTVKDYMSDRLLDAYFTQRIPSIPVKGFNIKLIDDMYETEYDTTGVKYIADGELVMKAAGTLGEVPLGISLIPGNNGLVNTVGFYSYASTTDDAPSVKIISGTKMLPDLKKRYGFLHADTEG